MSSTSRSKAVAEHLGADLDAEVVVTACLHEAGIGIDARFYSYAIVFALVPARVVSRPLWALADDARSGRRDLVGVILTHAKWWPIAGHLRVGSSLLFPSERSVGEIERELRLRSDGAMPSASDTLRSVLS